MTAGALARAVQRAQRAADPDERCELCAAAIAETHRHLLDVSQQRVLCACRACSILFDRDGAGSGQLKLIPERRVELSGFAPSSLGVPVGLAFFVVHGDGSVSAHYPSPAGATRWDVDVQSWHQATADEAQLAALEPEVEALLVNTARTRADAWLVPIDDCFRLVAIVRQSWRGMYGGDEVWQRIESFFDLLRRSDGTHSSR